MVSYQILTLVGLLALFSPATIGVSFTNGLLGLVVLPFPIGFPDHVSHSLTVLLGVIQDQFFKFFGRWLGTGIDHLPDIESPHDIPPKRFRFLVSIKPMDLLDLVTHLKSPDNFGGSRAMFLVIFILQTCHTFEGFVIIGDKDGMEEFFGTYP